MGMMTTPKVLIKVLSAYDEAGHAKIRQMLREDKKIIISSGFVEFTRQEDYDEFQNWRKEQATGAGSRQHSKSRGKRPSGQ